MFWQRGRGKFTIRQQISNSPSYCVGAMAACCTLVVGGALTLPLLWSCPSLLSSIFFFLKWVYMSREGIWVGCWGLEDEKPQDSILMAEFKPFPKTFRGRRGKGARRVGAARPCSSFPSSPLPPPSHCYIPFPEWSVSTGSAQDEMSYLRLILIS